MGFFSDISQGIGGFIGDITGGLFGTTKATEVQGQAASSASAAQIYAADRAYEATMAGIESTEAMTAPWREAGGRALGTLESMTARGPGAYTESPGYQFRLGEGEKAIERFASAKGGLLSGATGKALTAYGQDYATQDYDNFLTRYYQSLSPYQSLAGIGQTASAGTAATTAQGYGNLANIATQRGEAQAAGYLGQGQAQASGYLSQGKIMSDALNAFTLWNIFGK